MIFKCCMFERLDPIMSPCSLCHHQCVMCTVSPFTLPNAFAIIADKANLEDDMSAI